MAACSTAWRMKPAILKCSAGVLEPASCWTSGMTKSCSEAVSCVVVEEVLLICHARTGNTIRVSDLYIKERRER